MKKAFDFFSLTFYRSVKKILPRLPPVFMISCLPVKIPAFSNPVDPV
jgi:hypothetical protein